MPNKTYNNHFIHECTFYQNDSGSQITNFTINKSSCKVCSNERMEIPVQGKLGEGRCAVKNCDDFEKDSDDVTKTNYSRCNKQRCNGATTADQTFIRNDNHEHCIPAAEDANLACKPGSLKVLDTNK